MQLPQQNDDRFCQRNSRTSESRPDNSEAAREWTTLDRFACWIVDRVVTMGFFLIVPL
jgi:hypothetical protein